MRIGLGYDIHRLVPERPLILGGVTIPSETGPDAHSDGDALAHAIIDALLGAAALGNLGLLYPDNAPAYKDANSLELLRDTYARVQRAGYEIINIDTNVILEEPKLNPHLGAIRAKLAECLGIPVDAISVKPRTNELVGPEGRGKAIRSEAIALLERIASGG